MSTLSDKFVAFWELEEASGSRADSKGSSTLTDTNTVTSATGKVGTAASFASASSESLDCADNDALSMGLTNFYLCAWVWLTSVNGSGNGIIVKDDVGVNREYTLYYQASAGRFSFLTCTNANGAGAVTVVANNFGVASTNTWYFVQAWRDGTSNFISVNNGTADSAAAALAGWNGAATFRLGSLQNIAGYYHNGRLDQVGIAKTLPDSTERAFLYNSGDGRSWAEISAAAGGGPLYGSGALIDGPLYSGRLTA